MLIKACLSKLGNSHIGNLRFTLSLSKPNGYINLNSLLFDSSENYFPTADLDAIILFPSTFGRGKKYAVSRSL